MEDTMSSYSFSHQFYQRWTCAPEPVRAAITQELKDITTLLQADTPFESFEFNTHDLDTHVDELYDNYNAEQAIAKAIADKQEQANAAAEKQRLEEEQKKKAEEATLQAESELAEAAQKEQEKNEQIAADKNNTDEKVIATSLDAKLDITHQELIRELETQVDDYLSEQMMLLSENLKSWLRAEVTQHLSEQNDSTANNEAAKSIH